MRDASEARLYLDKDRVIRCSERGRSPGRKCDVPVIQRGKVTHHRAPGGKGRHHEFTLAELVRAAERAGQVKVPDLLRQVEEIRCADYRAECPVWQRVRIGDIDSAREMRQALTKVGVYHIEEEARQILEVIPLASRRRTISLVWFTLHQLGLSADRYENWYHLVCKTALSLGLQYCPAEVGPQLAMQLSLWWENRLTLLGSERTIVIGMKPVLVSHCSVGGMFSQSEAVFGINDGLGGRSLRCCYSKCSESDYFVFALPQDSRRCPQR